MPPEVAEALELAAEGGSMPQPMKNPHAEGATGKP